jgi:diguanylate cyclase (GGDEF)-like protein
LTGLGNRGFFEQRLDEELSRADRYGHELSLIMIDLDDFKSFNDTHGHPSGDALLRGASDAVRESLRDMDVAARYGGEEFVVVLPETDILGALAVADRIRERVEGCSVDVGAGERASRTASLGVAAWPDDATGAAELVAAADEALYRAKHAGKNRVEAAGVRNDAPD